MTCDVLPVAMFINRFLLYKLGIETPGPWWAMLERTFFLGRCSHIFRIYPPCNSLNGEIFHVLVVVKWSVKTFDPSKNIVYSWPPHNNMTPCGAIYIVQFQTIPSDDESLMMINLKILWIFLLVNHLFFNESYFSVYHCGAHPHTGDEIDNLLHWILCFETRTRTFYFQSHTKRTRIFPPNLGLRGETEKFSHFISRFETRSRSFSCDFQF